MSGVRGTLALAIAFLIETWRSKPAVFWNLLFPCLYVVGMAYIFAAGEPERVAQILPGIMTISVITASFFGVSLHMVTLREQEIYRRFRVTPVSALAVVLGHGVTALINITAGAVLQLGLARLVFGVTPRGGALEIAGAVLLAAFAFIPLGLLVGSAARDMRSAPVISNMLFMPMMFLSGAAMPLSLMPAWLQRLAHLVPATYVVEVLRAAIVHGSLGGALTAAGILVLTGAVALGCNVLLFRWETEEPINRKGMLGALALLGGVYAAAFVVRIPLESALPRPDAPQRGVARTVLPPRSQTLKGMTIVDGMGGRIGRGRIVLQDRHIVEVGPDDGSQPDVGETTDLSGQFLIPGLIDSHVHIGGSGGGAAESDEFAPDRMVHDLQVYLAMGVTSFVSMTDSLGDLRGLRDAVLQGTMRAPRPFFSGPGLTAPGGHPARYFRIIPGMDRQLTRQVTMVSEAEAAVSTLADQRVDLIKLFLEAGWSGDPAPLLAETALRAGIRAAHLRGMKATVHVDTDAHARLALAAGADSLEHVPHDLSAATVALLASRRVPVTPTLSVGDAQSRIVDGTWTPDALTRTWIRPGVLASLDSPNSWVARARASTAARAHYRRLWAGVRTAVRRCVNGGVLLLAGSDAGNAGVFHGLALLRELELLVEVGGMKPSDALLAATSRAADRLGARDLGRVAPGAFADLVVLKGDPTQDIRALRNVHSVYLGGIRLERDRLLTTSPGGWSPRAETAVE